MEIFSQEGEGTTIRINLPAAAAEKCEQEEVQGGADSETEGRSLRVLLVEDQATQRDVLEKMLETMGHQVYPAADGQKGLEAFREHEYELVIVDRAMPCMNGDEIARKLKGETPDVPVLMLTGFGDIMEASNEAPECIDELVSKPVTRENLGVAIQGLFEEQDA
jgi:CheY-like chemotaxis protein